MSNCFAIVLRCSASGSIFWIICEIPRRNRQAAMCVVLRMCSTVFSSCCSLYFTCILSFHYLFYPPTLDTKLVKFKHKSVLIRRGRYVQESLVFMCDMKTSNFQDFVPLVWHLMNTCSLLSVGHMMLLVNQKHFGGSGRFWTTKSHYSQV